jgi:hypothetical protein
MDKREILRACRAITDLHVSITRVTEDVTAILRNLAEGETPRRPPARAGRVLEMRRAVNE